MKTTRILLLLLCFLCTIRHTAAQEKREIAFTIDDVPVMRQEVMRHYMRLSTTEQQRIPIKEFLQRFVQYKLKVTDARRLGYDTLAVYRLQVQQLTEQHASSTQEAQDIRNRHAQAKREKRARRLQNTKVVTFRHLSLLMPQQTDARTFEEAGKRLTEIHRALQGGLSIEEAERKYGIVHRNIFGQSPDGSVEEVLLLPEVAGQLARLQVGAFSSPFTSPYGWHIVQRLPQASPNITPRYMVDKVIAGRTSLSAEEKQELEEGLLAYYWDRNHTQATQRTVTEKDLENYFKTNKQQYKWNVPHFKGAVIHCKDKRAAASLKKMLKKLPPERWAKALAHLAEEDSTKTAILETGLFRMGDNKTVDRLVFKLDNVRATPKAGYPYSFTLGKKLKKGAKSYTDVRERVEADYRASSADDTSSELERRYKVKIH